MNDLLWPSDQHNPTHQEVMGTTSLDEPPKFMKDGYEVSVRKEDVALKGKVTRKRKAAATA